MNTAEKFSRKKSVSPTSLEEATRRLRPALPRGGGFYPTPRDAITRSCRQPSQGERRSLYASRLFGEKEEIYTEHPLKALAGLAGLCVFLVTGIAVLYALTNLPH